MRVSGRSQALTSNALGAGGRRFESGRPDYRNCLLIGIFCYFVLRFGLGCAGNLDPYTTPVHQTLSPFGLRLDTSGMRGVCTGPSPASRSSLAGGRAVAGSNPVAPIPYRSAKASEHGATTPENAEPRGTLFARVRGCSWGLGPQNGPQNAEKRLRKAACERLPRGPDQVPSAGSFRSVMCLTASCERPRFSRSVRTRLVPQRTASRRAIPRSGGSERTLRRATEPAR